MILKVVRFTAPFGQALDVDGFVATIHEHKPNVVAFVHAEVKHLSPSKEKLVSFFL